MTYKAIFLFYGKKQAITLKTSLIGRKCIRVFQTHFHDHLNVINLSTLGKIPSRLLLNSEGPCLCKFRKRKKNSSFHANVVALHWRHGDARAKGPFCCLLPAILRKLTQPRQRRQCGSADPGETKGAGFVQVFVR